MDNVPITRRDTLRKMWGAFVGIGASVLAPIQAFAQLDNAIKHLESLERTDFRESFFKKKKLFEDMIGKTDSPVMRYINLPLDRISFDHLNIVMTKLLRVCPVAYAHTIEHIPELNPQKILGGMPSVLIELPVKNNTDAIVRGNGAVFVMDGERFIITAKHIVELSDIKYFKTPEKDVAIVRFKDYESINPEGARAISNAKIVNIEKLHSANSLSGKIVSIAGYDDDSLSTDGKKIFVSGFIPQTKAVYLWTWMCGIFGKAKMEHAEIPIRWDALPIEMKRAYAEYFYPVKDSLPTIGIVLLPPGESAIVDDGGQMLLSGMSGSPVLNNSGVCGIFSSSIGVPARSYSQFSGVDYTIAQVETGISGILAILMNTYNKKFKLSG